MALIPAKCSQCGGKIEIDDKKKSGKCKFCGTDFITEEVIQNNFTHISNSTNINTKNLTINQGDKNTFLSLARDSEEAGDVTVAIDYYNRVLEFDIDNYDALLGKAFCLFYTSTLANIKVQELTFYIKKGVDSYKKAHKEKLDCFYSTIISKSKNALLTLCKAASRSYGDSPRLRSSATSLKRELMTALSIHIFINDLLSKDYIANGSSNYKNNYVSFQEDGLYIAEMLVEPTPYYDVVGETETIEICDDEFNRINTYYTKSIDRILEIVPDYNLEDHSLQVARNKNYKQGCYIATAVYGSYDCPEVWVLRRYRDYKLSKSWLGRMFIRMYYKFSPGLARKCCDKKWFNKFWKRKLDKKVEKLRKHGYSSEKYDDPPYSY